MGVECTHFLFVKIKKRMVSNINNRKVAPNNVNDDLFNEKIPFREVLVINADGEQLGVMSKKEALDIAYKQNLDLLCVAPKARPAVCKVLDYGRYHFEQQKKLKKRNVNNMLLKLNLCVYHRLSIHTILKPKYVRRQNGSKRV